MKSNKYQCVYFYHTHPFYTIGPLKVEVHNDDPFIVQIYGVLSPREMNELKDEVKQELRQSRIIIAGAEEGKISRFRTSANAWIEDQVADKFTYLNKRISLMTGLNTEGFYSTEIIQIASYK